MKTLNTLVHKTVTALANKRQLPWTNDNEYINRLVDKIVTGLERCCPNITLKGDVIILGKHDHDDRFNPAPSWFSAEDGKLMPRTA